MYNCSYEICALGILLVVLWHVRIQNRVKTFSTRIFMFFTVCGVLDILLDIVTTVMIYRPEVYPAGLQAVLLECLYLLQLLIPYLLYLYVLSLRNQLLRKHLKFICLNSAVFVFMLGMVLANPLTGALFYFDRAGSYQRGPYYLAMYFYAVFYLLLSMMDTILYYHRFKRRYAIAIWEFVGISSTMVIVQIFFNDVLLTGVGIAVALIVLMLTINNPYDKLDILTGLLDLSGLKESLQECGTEYRCQLIVVACDNLKRINLAFGMEEGNRLLRELADEFASYVERENVFRFVSDQFVLVCREQGEYEAVLNRVCAFFDRPFAIRDVFVRFTACICGISNPTPCKTPEQLLDYINYLVSRAKKSGPGTIVEADDAIMKEYVHHKEIENYLYTAVRDKLFEAYFQPIYSLETGDFVSAEALVRLPHPEFGIISPSEFIPIAESSGEINQVEACIFEKVCQFLHEHPEVLERLETVKYNLSPASFLNSSLSRRTLEMIHRYGLDPHRFQFEITETAATVYDNEIGDWVEEIKRAGIGLCLDDFGSGYANLASVMRLPFDVIKMDRSMLVDATRNQQAAILYRNTVNTLSRLGFVVVAEGAETEEDVQLLSSFHVRYIQGYYYAKPMSQEEFLQKIIYRDTWVSPDAAELQGQEEGFFTVSDLTRGVRRGILVEQAKIRNPKE